MRGVVLADLGQRRGRRQPAGRAAHRLEDHELIDALHVAGEHAGLLDREGHVAGRRCRSRACGRCRTDRCRPSSARPRRSTRSPAAAIRLDAMDRVHRVVAADEEEVADVVLAEHVEDAGKVGLLELVAAASQGGTGRVPQGRDRGRPARLPRSITSPCMKPSMPNRIPSVLPMARLVAGTPR